MARGLGAIAARVGLVTVIVASAGCGSTANKAAKPEPPAWSPFSASLTRLIETWLDGTKGAATLESTRGYFAAQTWEKVQVGSRQGIDERVFVNNSSAGESVQTATMTWDRRHMPRALGLQLRGIAVDKVRQWLLELAPRYGGRYFRPHRDTYVNEKKPATALLPRATLQVRKNEKGVLVFVIGLRRYPDETLIDIAPSRFGEVRNQWREPSLSSDERKRAMVELDKLTAVAADRSATQIVNQPWRVAVNAVSFVMRTPALYGAELAEIAAALVALPKGSWDAALSNHLRPLMTEAGCAQSLGKVYQLPRNTRAAYLAGKCDWYGKRSLGANSGKLALWQVMLVAVTDYLADKHGIARWPLHARVRRSLLTATGTE